MPALPPACSGISGKLTSLRCSFPPVKWKHTMGLPGASTSPMPGTRPMLWNWHPAWGRALVPSPSAALSGTVPDGPGLPASRSNGQQPGDSGHWAAPQPHPTSTPPPGRAIINSSERWAGACAQGLLENHGRPLPSPSSPLPHTGRSETALCKPAVTAARWYTAHRVT